MIGRKVAWSRLGCVAFITGDGRGINVRSVVCGPKDGRWTLSQGYPTPQVSRVHGGLQLCHLSWNHSGTDLAIVDVLGRISVFTFMTALNRLGATRENISDQEDDLGAVVGLIWLNSGRMVALIGWRVVSND